MQLKVIGSDSSGNGYLLIAKTGTLLIECGVHFTRIKKALGFKLGNVAAIVSHSHGDHACAIGDVLHAGINVYASQDTFTARKVQAHHRAKPIAAGQPFTVLGFKIKPFEVNHDVPCFGFMIQHAEMGLTVFLTDTFFCDYVFPRVNNYILECNHDTEIMEQNDTPVFLRERVIQSHMNIKTCRQLLKANDLSLVNNIVLIHLSNANSNAAGFKKQVAEQTGKQVTIAEAGLVLDFNAQPI